MTSPVVIVGTGGHGREALDIVEAVGAVDPTLEFVGFLSDGPAPTDLLDRRGATVLGPTSWLADHPEVAYVLAVGWSHVRRAAHRDLPPGARSVSRLVHPAAELADCTVGEGLLAAAGVRAVGVSAGRHVHLNVNAVVERGAQLADFVTVSPGAVVGEGARLADGVFLSAGCRVEEGVRIGGEAVVGAGAVVRDDVAGGATVVGDPATALS